MEPLSAVYAGAANRVMDEAAMFELIQRRLARQEAAAVSTGSSVMAQSAEITQTQHQ